MIKSMEFVRRKFFIDEFIGIRKVQREGQKDWWMVYGVGEFRKGKRHGKSTYLKDFYDLKSH